jgi:hypothetical protein
VVPTSKILLVVCLAALAACGDSNTAPTPVALPPSTTLAPAPAPTPTPTPTPAPTPAPSFTANLRFVHNAVCPNGKHPPPGGALPVGCGRALHISYHYPNGTEVPLNVTGEAMTWVIEEGTEAIDMPADENPWRRWVTGKAPGPFRISVTLVSRKRHETVRGEISNRVIP